MNGFHTVLMDPPWEEKGGGRRGADQHYQVLPVPAIAQVILGSDVWAAVERDAHLWMWAPSRIRLAFELAALLGAGRQATLFSEGTEPLDPWVQTAWKPWVKTVPHYGLMPDTPGTLLYERQHGGLGQYHRSDSECLLLFTRGKAMVPARAYPEQAILAPRRRHSEKPPETYAHVEGISPGPYLEMFARRRRPGWTSWGNEIEEAAR